MFEENHFYTDVRIRPGNGFFPRSKSGQMTYRKLKPHASWQLQLHRGGIYTAGHEMPNAQAVGGYTPEKHFIRKVGAHAIILNSESAGLACPVVGKCITFSTDLLLQAANRGLQTINLT